MRSGWRGWTSAARKDLQFADFATPTGGVSETATHARQLEAMHLVHNERTKLTAAWLNTLATALLGAGALVPSAAWLYGFSVAPVETGALVVISLACIVVSAVIHSVGLALLGSLRE